MNTKEILSNLFNYSNINSSDTPPHTEPKWREALSQINIRLRDERLAKEKIWGKPKSKYHK